MSAEINMAEQKKSMNAKIVLDVLTKLIVANVPIVIVPQDLIEN